MTDARHTLYELNQLVRETLETEMPDEYWVEAELSECRESRGHCYLELIQKEEKTNTPIARASAKCWANSWTVIRPYFERTAGQPLHAGMKVLLKVYPQFHEAFGFSWIVTDIDPTYTIGDMARRRQEIIRQLKEEGVFDLQRELSLPLFAQRIAVITSETAAGYGDFLNQLQQNEYGFHFKVTLFPAIMQGEQVEQSVINALNQIHTEMSDNNDMFDVVVMIRGGGATSDLSGFDTLALAENVANFPIPIITGIGHERDECILDMISHTRVKTPTAAAAFLISHLAETDDLLNDIQNRMVRLVKERLTTHQLRLSSLSERIPSLFSVVKTRQEAHLDQLFARLQTQLQAIFVQQAHRLELLTQRTASLDPMLLLRRGYSITLHHGKVVSDPSQLREGDEIETRLEKGSVRSIVKPLSYIK